MPFFFWEITSGGGTGLVCAASAGTRYSHGPGVCHPPRIFLLFALSMYSTYYVPVPVERASLEILNSHASPFVTVLCVQLCTTTKTKQSADLH